MSAMNPLPIDLNRIVLRVGGAGVLEPRPEDEASVTDSFHQLFVVAQAIGVSDDARMANDGG